MHNTRRDVEMAVTAADDVTKNSILIKYEYMGWRLNPFLNSKSRQQRLISPVDLKTWRTGAVLKIGPKPLARMFRVS